MTDRPLLNVPAVARRLSIDAQTVRRLIKAGDLPAYQVGRSYRVEQSVLEHYLAECRLDKAT